MPAEAGLEKLDRGLLIGAGIGAKHAQSGAVVDRGVLVVALSTPGASCDRLDELHVDLHVMAGALLLVALPPPGVALIAL
jgi:hypothetical protein